MEDVLSITGFVSEYGKNANTDMAQIESDLMAALLGGGKKKTAMANQSSSSSMPQPENSLACFMCNRNGFKSAEEFGTHVALCDGSYRAKESILHMAWEQEQWLSGLDP